MSTIGSSLTEFAELYVDNDMRHVLEALAQRLSESDPEYGSDKYGVSTFISDHVLADNRLDVVYYQINKMYHALTKRVASIMISRDEWFLVRYLPVVQMTDYKMMAGLQLSVTAEIMVAPTNNVSIPTFIYSEQIVPRVIEWKCGYCTSVNEMKARECEKCGAPRALLIQEM